MKLLRLPQPEQLAPTDRPKQQSHLDAHHTDSDPPHGWVNPNSPDQIRYAFGRSPTTSPPAPKRGLKRTPDSKSRRSPEFQRWAATQMGTTRNWCKGGSGTGTYGNNYRQRTGANLIGIWANTSSEALYFQAGREEDGSPLNGSNSYVIHLLADQLPDAVVQAYWSVLLVSVPDYRVVPNRLNRYT